MKDKDVFSIKFTQTCYLGCGETFRGTYNEFKARRWGITGRGEIRFRNVLGFVCPTCTRLNKTALA
ncbi:hypothetical protein HUW62_05370 [Myxococcus sp. AM011]|uniref:hypothetical protein n=1 Tax=Myxococcus sp. AM011 TaxID=2745200 RepID=UPI001595D6EE|nr:hypothetical protein [Myxococcus sp. AM011]NVJ20651.1 hypothetical protein [Myxococcus sp. AM011]